MSKKERNWYEIDNIEELDSPSLLIYFERVIENIKKAIEIVGDANRLRPHIKTHKTKEAAILCMKQGISKFKCATIAEADLLGMIGAPDVLLAYQPSGPKIERFISVIKDFTRTRFSCLIDNIISAVEIARYAEKNYYQIPVFIDVNIGMNRTGIKPENVVELYKQCAGMNGITLMGIHVYDGHLHMENIEERTKICDELFEPIKSLISELKDIGIKKPTIIAGGSPTFMIHAKNKDVECSPGTFIFWDKGYSDICKDQPFIPAALVLSRIISLPEPTKICIDLGHKSVASENTLAKRIFFLNAPDIEPISHSEEHMVFSAPYGHNYRQGMILYGMPYHICPTVALYERATLIKQRRISDEWLISARDRRIIH